MKIRWYLCVWDNTSAINSTSSGFRCYRINGACPISVRWMGNVTCYTQRVQLRKICTNIIAFSYYYRGNGVLLFIFNSFILVCKYVSARATKGFHFRVITQRWRHKTSERVSRQKFHDEIRHQKKKIKQQNVLLNVFQCVSTSLTDSPSRALHRRRSHYI